MVSAEHSADTITRSIKAMIRFAIVAALLISGCQSAPRPTTEIRATIKAAASAEKPPEAAAEIFFRYTY